MNGSMETVDLSPEDAELKERLDLLVDRAFDQETQVAALTALGEAVRTATASLTSVPKPLKFLRPHYGRLKRLTESVSEGSFLYNLLSVLAMTMAESGSFECLLFRLRGDACIPVGYWGQEYVRSLVGEIGGAIDSGLVERDQVSALISEILSYLMETHAEIDACDLCLETGELDRLRKFDFHDRHSQDRVCLYLISCAAYLPEPENKQALRLALDLYLKAERYTHAFRVAKILGEPELVPLELVSPGPMRIQLELSQTPKDWSKHYHDVAQELEILEAKTPEDIYKSHLVESSRRLSTILGSTHVDSARENLAASLVNAFVNAGFGADKFITNPSEDQRRDWIFRNRAHGMLSATASLGMIFLYDIDGGLAEIDKYLYSPEEYVRAGALLAIGLLSAGRVSDECDAALALLAEHIESEDGTVRLAAILGLGFAYAGTQRMDLLEMLAPTLADVGTPTDIAAVTALALGLVFVASANADLAATLVQAIQDHYGEVGADQHTDNMDSTAGGAKPSAGEGDVGEHMELVPPSQPASSHHMDGLENHRAGGMTDHSTQAKAPHHTAAMGEAAASGNRSTTTPDSEARTENRNESHVRHPLARLFPLALGLLYLHKRGLSIEPVIDALRAMGVDTPLVIQIVECCAFFGTGDVLALQRFLGWETELAPLAVAANATGEGIALQMLLRLFDRMLQFGSETQRRAVPLALGLAYVSNPRLEVVDTLSKLSHDGDTEIASGAILAMGLVAAGTNQARVAGLLRELSAFYAEDPPMLFVVRLAQGLTHAGRGMLTLSPFYSDGAVLDPVAAAGLVTLLVLCLGTGSMRETLLGRYHFFFYALALAARPRFLVTLDADTMEPVQVPVRVGQAVDTVGQAGRPRTITGFQTHSTPVLIGVGERAELATDEWVSYAPVLEGMVLVQRRERLTASEHKTTN
jgi:26S proteasome regulatory subunit N1